MNKLKEGDKIPPISLKDFKKQQDKRREQEHGNG